MTDQLMDFLGLNSIKLRDLPLIFEVNNVKESESNGLSYCESNFWGRWGRFIHTRCSVGESCHTQMLLFCWEVPSGLPGMDLYSILVIVGTRGFFRTKASALSWEAVFLQSHRAEKMPLRCSALRFSISISMHIKEKVKFFFGGQCKEKSTFVTSSLTLVAQQQHLICWSSAKHNHQDFSKGSLGMNGS